MGPERRQEPDSTESIVVAILTEIAKREGDPPTELTPPLYTVIDPDVLEELFGSPKYGKSRDSITLEFTYLNYRIVVGGLDEIEVHDT